IAVLREVRLRPAGKTHLQDTIRIVDAGAGEIEGNRVVLLEEAVVPNRGLDDVQLGVKMDFVKLVDKDDRWISKGVEVTGRDLHFELVVGGISQLLHDLA